MAQTLLVPVHEQVEGGGEPQARDTAPRRTVNPAFLNRFSMSGARARRVSRGAVGVKDFTLPLREVCHDLCLEPAGSVARRS